jgi:hypothetical protein
VRARGTRQWSGYFSAGEISNFAIPDQQGQQARPVLRQLSIKASTLAQVGKPMVVGSVDDPTPSASFNWK